MTISDTTKYLSHGFIFQVICSSNYKIYYLVFMNKITIPNFIIDRIKEYMYVPRVKMRDQTRSEYVQP